MIQVAFNAKLESSSYKIALDVAKFSGAQHLTRKLNHGTAELCSTRRIPVLGFADKTFSKGRKPLCKAGKNNLNSELHAPELKVSVLEMPRMFSLNSQQEVPAGWLGTWLQRSPAVPVCFKWTPFVSLTLQPHHLLICAAMGRSSNMTALSSGGVFCQFTGKAGNL